jgi:hypothetical protein
MCAECVLVLAVDKVLVDGPVPARVSTGPEIVVDVAPEDIEEALQALSLRPEDYEVYRLYASCGLQALFWDAFLEAECASTVRDLNNTRRKYEDLLSSKIKADIHCLSLEIKVCAEKKTSVLRLLESPEVFDRFTGAMVGSLGVRFGLFTQENEQNVFAERHPHTKLTVEEVVGL